MVGMLPEQVSLNGGAKEYRGFPNTTSVWTIYWIKIYVRTILCNNVCEGLYCRSTKVGDFSTKEHYFCLLKFRVLSICYLSSRII